MFFQVLSFVFLAPLYVLLSPPDVFLPVCYLWCLLLPPAVYSCLWSILLPPPDISLPVEYPAASSGHISACERSAASSGHISACGVSCCLLRICSCLCAFFISVLLVPLTSSIAFLTLYVPFPLQYNSPCRTSRFHPFPVSEFHSCCPVSNIFRPCPCPFPHP